jgi:hypothetical protein
MIDAEFGVSCLFFILGIVVLNFWLINLFVAVITNTFQAIRSQTRKSAFGATQYVLSFLNYMLLTLAYRSKKAIVDGRDGWAMVEASHLSKANWMRESYRITRLVWPALAVLSLGLAASKTATTPSDSIHTLGTYIRCDLCISFHGWSCR